MQGSIIINLDGDTFSICIKGNKGLMCLREGKIGDSITNVDEVYDILHSALEGNDDVEDDSPFAEIIPADINPCTFCSNIEDTATTRYLVSRSDLPNEIKAKLLNHIESWLPEYQSQLHHSLHKALMSMELRGNNLLRSLLYEEAIKRGFDPKHITVCGRVYHQD